MSGLKVSEYRALGYRVLGLRGAFFEVRALEFHGYSKNCFHKILYDE